MKTAELFARLTTTHRPDCAMFDDGPAPKTVPKPEELARVFGSDAAALYASQCQPIYEDLRRVVGQLAGLMILAQLTKSTDVSDLSELASCETRWSQAGERIKALSAPNGLAQHLEQLSAAQVFSGHALRTFSELRPRSDNDACFDAIARHVRRAYAHLSAASTEKAGLEMVDLTHACCSCGR